MKKGKLFVFEGIDGSGKSTQTKLLANYFIKKGFKVKKIDFPRYGERSAAMFENYLAGKYGGPKEVGPYVASIFIAQDRYDASFEIKKWLSQGKIVISDRWMASNIGHQGGKLINNHKKWRKYVNWLYDLEYGIFGITKPDYTFILKTSPEFSIKLNKNLTDKDKIKKREAYLGRGGKDIHEKDKDHFVASLKSYLLAAKEFPKDFKVIECLDRGKLLAPEIINQKIIKSL
ncbi:MAG: thymidylate kinase [Candidatus Staskawiczbacteria bacterium]|jgi:dTMP kinase